MWHSHIYCSWNFFKGKCLQLLQKVAFVRLLHKRSWRQNVIQHILTCYGCVLARILRYKTYLERLSQHCVVWHKVTKMNLYLIGSDRKQRPHARRAFCHRLRAAMALLNVTGIGLSPRWNLQNGTRPACVERKTLRIKKIYIYKLNYHPFLVLLLLRVLYLFEGLPKLSSRSHAQLLCDVSWNFEQENLHQAGHHPILTNTEGSHKCLQITYMPSVVIL